MGRVIRLAWRIPRLNVAVTAIFLTEDLLLKERLMTRFQFISNLNFISYSQNIAWCYLLLFYGALTRFERI